MELQSDQYYNYTLYTQNVHLQNTCAFTVYLLHLVVDQKQAELPSPSLLVL